MRSVGSGKAALWLTVLALLLLAPVVSASDGVAGGGAVSPGEQFVQRGAPQEGQGWGSRLRGWWRRTSEYQKNHASVKAAYRPAVAAASSAVAQVLADGEPVALATVVDPDGLLVTKASLIDGALVCKFGNGDERPAVLVGANQEHDLALLKVDAHDLPVAVWRTEPPAPGTLVAAVAPDGDVLGIGIVSSEPRTVPGPRRSPRSGYLGVTLAGGATGVLVTDVAADSAAATAGIQIGDEVRSIDGVAMRTIDQVVETVGNHPVGQTLHIVLRREAEQFTVSAVLGKRPPTLARDPAPEDHWGGGPFSERRTGFSRVVPHDTIVPPNQCGGPLVDTDGRVLGINIARALRVTTYALPADVVQQVVAQLKPAAAAAAVP